jgi:hypothetical protein
MQEQPAQVNRSVRPEMPLWTRLCGSSLSRRRGEEGRSEAGEPLSETPLALKADSVMSPSKEVASGTLALNGYGLKVPITVPSDNHTDVPSVPWYTIRSFMGFVKQRRRRLGLRVAWKNQPQTQECITVPLGNTQDVDIPSQPSDGSPKTGGRADSSDVPIHEELEEANRDELEGTDLPLSSSDHVPMTTMGFQENGELEADVGIGKPRLGAISFAEERSTSETFIRTLETGGCEQIESQPEIVSGRNPLTTNESADTGSETESARSTRRRPIASSKQDSDEWCVFAVLIKDALGELKSEMTLYDSGSPVSWVSQKFVRKHKLEPRPISPSDLKEYSNIWNQLVIPTFYVEIELKDEHNGMDKFQKVPFNISEDMGGRGLILGRAFMKEHGVVLDPKRGAGVYVATAREASDGKQDGTLLQFLELTIMQQRRRKLSNVWWSAVSGIVSWLKPSRRQLLVQQRQALASQSSRSQHYRLEPARRRVHPNRNRLPSTRERGR